MSIRPVHFLMIFIVLSGLTPVFLPVTWLPWHGVVVSYATTLWLGVRAWRQTGSRIAVLCSAGGPLVIGTWLAVINVMAMLDNAQVPMPLFFLGVAFGISLIFLTHLPRIYPDGRVVIDPFSARKALDGLIVATAVSVVVVKLAVQSIAEYEEFTLQLAILVFAASSIVKSRPHYQPDTVRAAFAAAMIVGVVVPLHTVTGDVGLFLSFMISNVGMMGQAWSLQVYEAHRPNSQRVFEGENVLPMLMLLAAWTGVLVTTWLSVSDPLVKELGGWSVMLLASRIAVSRSAEDLVLESVRKLVYSDTLTGVGNRRALLERLAHGPGWVMSLDLDSFKSINDQFGHEAGDVVLVRFANRVARILPENAEFFRIGGDEFAVVVPHTARNIKSLSRDIVRSGSDPHHSEVSVSVGVAPFGRGESPAAALRGSDIALQEAKRLGKNRAAVLDDTMLDDRMRELSIASRLRSGGIEDIYVVYQPLVAMRWAEAPLIGVEALARWNDRELGHIPPGEFVPVAERQGMIPELGLTVLQQALEQLRMWMDQGTPVQISINVSVLQLRDSHVVAQMERLLAVEPELARWIIFEVTETVFTDDDRAVNALRQLRSLGLCTALDDFGTGASTLTRLRHLPIDILKIDRSLVMGAGTDASADAILDMVATLGRRMEMVLIAEGLEDATATNRCADLGYSVGQGFFFSQPVPANMLPAFAQLARPAMPRRAMVDKLWTSAGLAEAASGPPARPEMDGDERAAAPSPSTPMPPAPRIPNQAGWAPNPHRTGYEAGQL